MEFKKFCFLYFCSIDFKLNQLIRDIFSKYHVFESNEVRGSSLRLFNKKKQSSSILRNAYSEHFSGNTHKKSTNKWDKALKNGPSEICGRQPLKNWSEYGLNAEWYRVSLRIQYECAKIRTRKNSVFGHFLRSDTNGR